jgi:hypothetical protein
MLFILVIVRIHVKETFLIVKNKKLLTSKGDDASKILL